MYYRPTTNYRMPGQTPQLPGHDDHRELIAQNRPATPTQQSGYRPQYMSYDAAVRQAQAALDPQYQRTLNTTLQNLDRNSISRGFYGQMPADVFKRATAGDLAMQHQGNVSQYANNLQQQSFQNQMAYDQFQFQKQQYGDQQGGQLWQTIGSLASILLPLLL